MNQKSNGVAVAALVCGLVAFLINPLYLVSTAAIICAIVALCAKNQSSKGLAIVGLCCGIGAVGVQVIVDIILLPFTCGASFCI